jgi:hypothetical protein
MRHVARADVDGNDWRLCGAVGQAASDDNRDDENGFHVFGDVHFASFSVGVHNDCTVDKQK